MRLSCLLSVQSVVGTRDLALSTQADPSLRGGPNRRARIMKDASKGHGSKAIEAQHVERVGASTMDGADSAPTAAVARR